MQKVNQQQKETFLCLAHNVVVSDGELCTGERAMLADMRIEMAIDDTYEAHYLPVQGLAQLFDQRRSRVIVLMSLIQLGHADNAYEIEERCVITELATHKAANPDFNITHVHFFPLGGIKTNANWAIENGGPAAKPANSV